MDRFGNKDMVDWGTQSVSKDYTKDIEDLRKCKGFEPWMENWINFKNVGDLRWWFITLMECYHPDYCIFYASSDHQQVVDAFSRFPYKG